MPEFATLDDIESGNIPPPADAGTTEFATADQIDAMSVSQPSMPNFGASIAPPMPPPPPPLAQTWGDSISSALTARNFSNQRMNLANQQMRDEAAFGQDIQPTPGMQQALNQQVPSGPIAPVDARGFVREQGNAQRDELLRQQIQQQQRVNSPTVDTAFAVGDIAGTLGRFMVNPFGAAAGMGQEAAVNAYDANERWARQQGADPRLAQGMGLDAADAIGTASLGAGMIPGIGGKGIGGYLGAAVVGGAQSLVPQVAQNTINNEPVQWGEAIKNAAIATVLHGAFSAIRSAFAGLHSEKPLTDYYHERAAQAQTAEEAQQVAQEAQATAQSVRAEEQQQAAQPENPYASAEGRQRARSAAAESRASSTISEADARAALGLHPTEPLTAEQITSAWRAAVRQAHPDAGGQQSDFEYVNKAQEALMSRYGSNRQPSARPVAPEPPISPPTPDTSEPAYVAPESTSSDVLATDTPTTPELTPFQRYRAKIEQPQAEAPPPAPRPRRSIAERADHTDGFDRRRMEIQQRIADGKTVSRAILAPFLGEPWADAHLEGRAEPRQLSPEGITSRREELTNQLRDLVVKEFGPGISDYADTLPLVKAAHRGEAPPGTLISPEKAHELAAMLPEDHPARLVLHNLQELAKNPRGSKFQKVNTNDVADGTRVQVNPNETLTINHSTGMVEDGVKSQIPEGGIDLYGRKVLPPLEGEVPEGHFSPDEVHQTMVESGVAPERAVETINKLAQENQDAAPQRQELQSHSGEQQAVGAGGSLASGSAQDRAGVGTQEQVTGLERRILITLRDSAGMEFNLPEASQRVRERTLRSMQDRGLIQYASDSGSDPNIGRGWRLTEKGKVAVAEPPVVGESSAIQSDLYGHPFIASSGVGEQQPMFHEPTQHAPAAVERVGSKSANDPKNTGEMFATKQEPHPAYKQSMASRNFGEAPPTPIDTSDMPIKVSPDDVSFDAGVRAHSGTSMVPEDRARMHQRDYVQHMRGVYDELAPLAKTDEQKAILKSELERYQQGYLDRLHGYLSAHSRVVSSFIAGPSRFPARQMQKRGDSADRRSSELVEWDKRAQAAMKKAISPESEKIISSDNPDAPVLLQKKIDAAKRLQEVMRAGNKIIRDKKLTDDQKIEKLKQLGLREDIARESLKPDFANRIGFADYELQNNLANIKRMESRVADLAQRRSAETTESEFDGGKIIENVEDNRLQVFFDSKPPEEMRNTLKGHGFKWAPSVGAWQRQLTPHAKDVAKRIFKPRTGHVALPDASAAIGEVRHIRERFSPIESKDNPALAKAFTKVVQASDESQTIVAKFEREAFNDDPAKIKDFRDLGWHYRQVDLNNRGIPALGIPTMPTARVMAVSSDPAITNAIKLWKRDIAPKIEAIRTSRGMIMSPTLRMFPFILNLPGESNPASNSSRGVNTNTPFNKPAEGEGDYQSDPHETLVSVVRAHLSTDAVKELASEIRKISIPPATVRDPLGLRNPTTMKPGMPSPTVGQKAARGTYFVAPYKGRTEEVAVVDLSDNPYKTDYHYVPLRVADEFNNIRQERGRYNTLLDKAMHGATRLALIGDFAPHTIRVLFQVGARMGQSGENLATIVPYFGSVPAAARKLVQLAKSPYGQALQLLNDRSGSNRGAGFGLNQDVTSPLLKVLDIPHQALMNPKYGVDPMARRAVLDSHLRMQLGNAYVDKVQKDVEAGTITAIEAADGIEKRLSAKEFQAMGRRVNATLGFANTQTRSELLNWLQRVLPFISSESGMIPDEIRKLVTGNLNVPTLYRSMKGGKYAQAVAQLAGMLAMGTVGVYLAKQAANKLLSGHYMDQNDEAHKTDIQVAPGWHWSNFDPTLARAERITAAKQVQNHQVRTPGQYVKAVGREAVNEVLSVLNPGLRMLFASATGKEAYLTDENGLMDAKSTRAWPFGIGRNTVDAASQGKPLVPGMIKDAASTLLGAQLRESSGKNYTPAERLAHQIMRHKMSGIEVTDEQRKRHETRREVIDLLRKDHAAGEKKLTEAVKAGMIPAMGRPEINRDSKHSDFENLVRHLDVEESMKVWDEATPEERMKLRPIVLLHVVNSKTMTNAEKADVRRKVLGATTRKAG